MTPEQPTEPAHRLGYLLSAFPAALLLGHKLGPQRPPIRYLGCKPSPLQDHLPLPLAETPRCPPPTQHPTTAGLADTPPYRCSPISSGGRPPSDSLTASARPHGLSQLQSYGQLCGYEGLFLFRCVQRGEKPCLICSLQKSSICYSARHTRINKSLIDESNHRSFAQFIQ